MPEHDPRAEAHAAIDRLPEEALLDRGRLKISWPVATFEATDGQVTVHNLFLGTTCHAGRLLDIAGSAVTGADGSVTVSMNALHCLDNPAEAGTNTLGYDDPVSLVATVRGSTPALVSAESQVGPGTDGRPQDLFVTFRTFDLAGAPAAGVVLGWRCWVPLLSVVG